MNDEAKKQFEACYKSDDYLQPNLGVCSSGVYVSTHVQDAYDSFVAGKQAALEEIRQKVEAMCSSDKPSLYSVTGNVTDFNTLLVSVNDLRGLVGEV